MKLVPRVLPIVVWCILLNFTAFSQSFNSSKLAGESINNPTSLQFGPDGHLYASQQDGIIYAYTVSGNESSDYQVTATENITDLSEPLSAGTWEYINDGTTCNATGTAGSCCQGRHEGAYVQVGNKFYLLGGRENNSNVNIYNPATDSWTIGADAPFSIHHFQAVEYEGLIWMAGAMTGNFPNEDPIDKIIIYDPINDEWLDGPSIPDNRQRGSAGVVVYNDKIYLVCGIENGHRSGWVSWMDEYNPMTNTWRTLPNAPHARDHFQAALADGKIYVGGGRRSGQDGTFDATEAAIDVFDLTTEKWTTLANDIPTQRAAATVAVIGDEIIYIGGEKNSGLANNETEALNVNTGSWRTLSPLNVGRHGSQGIVNNENIWIAGGSPKRGGGTTLTHERFYFDEPQDPILTKINKASLVVEEQIAIDNGTTLITVSHSGANQAILVESIAFTGGSDFQYNSFKTPPFILKAGESFDLEVSFSGSGKESAQIDIGHNGSNGKITAINLFTGSTGNIAPLGIASQSSTRFGGAATRAIDENTNGVWKQNSVTHTASQANAWWQVDWDETYRIDQIQIYNRTDCCSDRLTNFTVYVLDDAGNTVFSKSYNSAPDPSLTIDISGGAIGHSVKIQLDGTNALSLAEVFVFGEELSGGQSFIPDPNKTYYLDVPTHNLRLAATGQSEDAYTIPINSINAFGNDVEWKFVDKGNGFWHLQRAAGGSKPRLRTDATSNADMQATSNAGIYTYYRFDFGNTSGTHYITLPDGPADFQRLQMSPAGEILFTTTAFGGNWVSWKITEVNTITLIPFNTSSVQVDDCSSVSISASASAITVSNLVAAVSDIQILDEDNKEVARCAFNCGESESFDLPAGTYQVTVKKFSAAYAQLCEKNESITIEETLTSGERLRPAAVPTVKTEKETKLEIQKSAKSSMAMEIAPNPVRDQFSVNFQAIKGETYHLSVIDLLGKVHYQQDFIGEADNMKLDLNSSNWEGGIYFLVLESELHAEVQQMVIVK